MKFTFDLTKQDYLDFNLFTMRNYKIYKRQKKFFQILFALTPIFASLIVWFLEEKPRPIFEDGVVFFIMVVIAVLFWAYSPKLYEKVTQRNAEKVLFKEGKLNIFGERVFYFEEGHIRYITEYEEGITKYEIITDMKVSNTAIYLYTSPAMAVIIPLRVFESENEKQKFINFMNTKMKS